jgi:hypothetical protein
VKRPAKWACAFAVIGSIFPILYLALYHIGTVRRFPDWGIYLWPTAIQLMLTDGHEDDRLWVMEIVSISVGLNALLWFVVGLLIALLAGKVGRGRKIALRPNKPYMDSSRK